MEFLTNTNFNFVDKTKYTWILSAVVILVGLASLIMHGGPHLSIDFTGGTILQVRINPAPEISSVRSALEDAGFEGLQVQDFGAEDEFLITMPRVSEGTLDAAQAMKNALDAGLSDATVEMRREESVGPKIGGELKTAAMNSVVAALVLIVLYITVRFIFRYGIAAIIALVHDVTITLGVFSLMDKEISLSIGT
jgi:preprotein translocase subunit SecF